RVTYAYTRAGQDFDDRTVVDSRRDGAQNVERPDLAYDEGDINVGGVIQDVLYSLNLSDASTGIGLGSLDFTTTDDTYETDIEEVQAWWVDLFGGLGPGSYSLDLSTDAPFFGAGPLGFEIEADGPGDGDDEDEDDTPGDGDGPGDGDEPGDGDDDEDDT